MGLKDRKGNVTSLRNDGTTNPQVTPLYLVLETLNEIDQAFATYAQANPMDTQRQVQWRLARSQMVDQFLGVNGQNTTMQSFKDPSLPAILPRAARRRARADRRALPGAALRDVRLGAAAAHAERGRDDRRAHVRDARSTSWKRCARTTPGRQSLEQLLTYLVDAGVEQRGARRVPGVDG